jgi:uncharacterized membrane protein YraQ (UPF0718 family)
LSVDSIVAAPVRRRNALAGALAFGALAVVGLAWAKWVPYLHRLDVTASSGAYPGHDVLDKAGAPGDGPSFAGGWAFTRAYVIAIWPALVAALVIAASVETLLPRRWLLRALGRDGALGRLTGGVAALPSMMCTCCTAPVARSLRQAGVPTGTALAYWLGNPVLNPAVLAFLAIVLPWQWVFTRVAVGLVLVFGVTGLIARLSRRDEVPFEPVEQATTAPEPRRFPAALARMTLLLVPEYVAVVFAVGALRGWLLPVGDAATDAAVAVTLLAAVAGTLVVIPTAGEIPLIAGLLVAGVGRGPLGALLIALPAISLPSMVMVARAMTWRVTVAAAAGVALCAVAAGALLAALG